MPTTRASTAPITSVTSLSEALTHQLESSTSTIIYVPLDGGDAPSDAELKALMAAGLHVEHDAVRDALAVRKATEDEIAEASAPAAEAAPAPPHASATASTHTA